MGNEFFYESSDSNAVFISDGAIQLLPVLLKEGAPFVRFADTYIPPQQLPDFERFEKLPHLRPKLEPLPTTTQPIARSAPNMSSIRERLAAAQRQWAEQTEIRQEKA